MTEHGGPADERELTDEEVEAIRESQQQDDTPDANDPEVG
jgi:hypothetical protein